MSGWGFRCGTHRVVSDATSASMPEDAIGLADECLRNRHRLLATTLIGLRTHTYPDEATIDPARTYCFCRTRGNWRTRHDSNLSFAFSEAGFYAADRLSSDRIADPCRPRRNQARFGYPIGPLL